MSCAAGAIDVTDPEALNAVAARYMDAVQSALSGKYRLRRWVEVTPSMGYLF